MARLKVPSLQHLARNWRDTPDLVRRSLVDLARNPPQFSYDPLFGAIRDLLVLGVPYEQVEEGIRRGVKRPFVRKILLEVLPLIRDHFDGLVPDFPPQLVARRYYSVARDLQIPFQPPMLYGLGGQLHLPWFSFWRSNALQGVRLSLFATLAAEVMQEDSDLDRARLHILDCSVPKGETERRLIVIEAQDVPRLQDAEKREMLEIWAEGYRLARDDLARQPDVAKPQDEQGRRDDDGQGDMFPRQPS